MSRKAVVERTLNCATGHKGPDTLVKVHLYENRKLMDTRDVSNKSNAYIDDLVENWESGIIKIEDNRNNEQ